MKLVELVKGLQKERGITTMYISSNQNQSQVGNLMYEKIFRNITR